MESKPPLSPCYPIQYQRVPGNVYHKIYLSSYSDFYELDQLKDTLSTVVRHTKAHFVRHGIPLRSLTDDGPQFMSREYQIFTQSSGFEHITSSPYWSQNNEKAEAAVKDAKSVSKKSQDYHLALLNIRNTQPRGCSFSLAQRLMGRRTRSSLPLCGERLLPDTPVPRTVTQEIANHRATSKASYEINL